MRLKNVITLTLYSCLVAGLGMWSGYAMQKPPHAITFVPSCAGTI